MRRGGLFYSLCLYKTGNLDLVIKKPSFILLRYHLFDPRLFIAVTFSFRLSNKMVDFIYEKVCVRPFEAHTKNV